MLLRTTLIVVEMTVVWVSLFLIATVMCSVMALGTAAMTFP